MTSLPAPVLAALERRDLDAAEDLAKEFVRNEPLSGPAWALLAVLSAQRGETEEALVLNQTALDCQPRDAGTWLNQGNLLKIVGRIEDAVRAYETALECDPAQVEAVFNLGVLAGEQGRSKQAESRYREALRLAPSHSSAMYNLALELSRRSAQRSVHADEVVTLYRGALEIQSLWPEAWRNLGNFLRDLQRDEEAIQAYEEVIRLQPADETTVHLLAALKKDTPSRAGSGYVSQLFDRFAQSYDQDLAEGLAYEGATRLAGIVRPQIKQVTPTILDLGCGTGLFLESLAPGGADAVGVDLSSQMIERARAKDIYAALNVSAISDFLDSSSLKFDLVAAADVFVYLGDLSPVFRQIAAALNEGALFAFTVECWDDATGSEGYELQRSGRYRHRASYLKELISRSCFEVVHWETSLLRREKGVAVTGEYVVVQATADSVA